MESQANKAYDICPSGSSLIVHYDYLQLHLFSTHDLTLFIFLAEKFSCIYANHIFKIHSPVVGHLAWYRNLASVNRVVMEMDIQGPL